MAPLHAAGKTTKSGDTLKAGIRREELGSSSDTLSSDPNACPLISTFSKPHSEVVSTTHIPALKEISKRRFAVFWFAQDGRSPANAAFKNAPRRELSRQKTTAPQPAKTYNKRRTFPPKDPPSPIHQKLITREDQLAGPNRTANPLPEIQSELPLGFNFCFAAEAPLSPPFRNPASNRRFSDVIFTRKAPPQIQIDPRAITTVLCNNRTVSYKILPLK